MFAYGLFLCSFLMLFAAAATPVATAASLPAFHPPVYAEDCHMLAGRVSERRSG